MHIGLTGYMATGKGEVSRFMKKKGYEYISLSDVVRDKADERKLSHTRENLQKIGNELRKKHGPEYFAKKVYEKIIKSGRENWIIDGIRNPSEINELKKLDKFFLLGITASPETIVKRIVSRNRKGDKSKKSEILKKLDAEKGTNQPDDGQQVKKCLDIANFLIVNEDTLEQLKNKLNHFIGLVSGKERPNFDEVFMGIAYKWADRSTCLRRKVGAVIAKDSQQLTAGYNGAPKGMLHCAELGGCLREKLNIPSGQRHEICRGTHAEQNAITQAAKFGINIEGGTLYCNTHPCVICSKMIINAGIEKVIYDSDYDDELSKEMLKEQKELKLIRYEGLRFNPLF